MGKEFYGFDIFEIFDPADKTDNIAAGTAAETIKRLAFRINGERTGFFGMERAKPGGNSSAFAKLNIALNNGFDIAVHF